MLSTSFPRTFSPLGQSRVAASGRAPPVLAKLVSPLPTRPAIGGLPAPKSRQLRLAVLPKLKELPDVRQKIPAEIKPDLSAWLTLTAYAVLYVTQFKNAPTPGLLYSVLAIYQLLWTALGALTGSFGFDRVATVVGPAFLATQALPQLASRVSAWDTAAALFGFFLARGLPVPLWASLPTLAYAIYANRASEWAVAAFGLASAWKLAEHFRSGASGNPPLQHVAFTALAGWAIYNAQATLLALLIFGSQLLTSALTEG